ncbi:MAG: hypothetical protein SFW09_13345, partial [Hyphomicrobiaceae bacterium]|nr:hypothetical protein [Hyphomicrobiaceae bacterium]
CLQELAAGDIDQVREATGLGHVHFIQMAIHPQDGRAFGVGILAQRPFIEADFITYAGDGDGTTLFDRTTPESKIATCRYAVARARLAIRGLDLRIATTHFPWTPDGGARDFQHHAVARLIAGLRGPPIVLTGDFNAPRGGPIFAELARVWTDCIPGEAKTSLDPVLHRAAPLELMVDGLFLSPHYRADDVRLHTGVSDHQAITARLSAMG